MTPVEPAAFAAQLIARLERLKREQETMSSLEERLQQIQEVSVYCHLASHSNVCLILIYSFHDIFCYTYKSLQPS